MFIKINNDVGNSRITINTSHVAIIGSVYQRQDGKGGFNIIFSNDLTQQSLYKNIEEAARVHEILLELVGAQ